MMRKLLSAILIAALSAASFVYAYADDDTLKSGIFTYTLSNAGVTVTSVDDTRGSVTVPDTIDGHTVTAIGDGAFGGSSNITNVYIPDTVRSIGSMCFAYSSSIRTVRLPRGTTEVKDGMFYQCEALSGVSVPYGVTSIGATAFSRCPNLTAVTIPNSIKSIADNAFSDSSAVRFYCYCSEDAVGYSYAAARGIDCEELITVYVNGAEIDFDQPPVTDKKRFRTLVPMRAVLEAMGAEIEWFNDMNYAGIDINGHRLLIRPGSDFMMADGKAVTLTSPAIEYNNRILLPIRHIVEAVGGKVGWDEYNKTITVTY